jgi:hypothetical protein
MRSIRSLETVVLLTIACICLASKNLYDVANSRVAELDKDSFNVLTTLNKKAVLVFYAPVSSSPQ